MKWNPKRAAVLGAGTMGARIAAHLANCGVPCYLLDVVPQELTCEEKKKGADLSSPAVRNRIARAGLDGALKGRPGALYADHLASLITPGNIEDHLPLLSEADWIIEAVVEKLEIKRALLQKVAGVRRPDSVVSTNTSGLSIARIADGLPQEFRQHWLGAHFFNPPRYLHLLEIIPGPETLPEVIDHVTQFADVRLGKGVVRAKDTPNFIANRIGVFSTCNIFRVMQEEGLTIEEVDLLTGPVLGWPRSATFGTIDLVGLDILADVTHNVYENVPNDESRDVFCLPDFVGRMIGRGLLGDKTGAGFYKRPKPSSGKEEALTIDLKTLEYRPRKKAAFPSVDLARSKEDAGERLRALFASGDKASQCAWKILAPTLLYCARRIPEIADRVIDIDRAMRWGFGWELGPFELWDAIGVSDSVRRMRQEKLNIPEKVSGMLSVGKTHFYDDGPQGRKFFDFSRRDYDLADQAPGVLLLHGGRDLIRVILKNADASLLDLGGGVICVEFHTKMNAIGPGIIGAINDGLRELAKNFEALVIANQGANFSAGANLVLLLMEIRNQEWDEIEAMERAFQQMTLDLKYSPKPVVVAPFRMTLGGGCELVLAAPRVQAAAETYMGLVEAGVGLIPGGGGLKEMAIRIEELSDNGEMVSPLREIFQTIGFAKVSTSAEDARRLRFLRQSDGVTVNPDRLVADAKEAALDMAREGYRRYCPGPRRDIRVGGEAALAELKIGIHIARQGEYITAYDATIATKIATVLCGGKITGPAVVSEQYLLDLEREAFLSLCGEPNTQARIEHMLQTGKPLRN